jgi:hypothetical protein
VGVDILWPNGETEVIKGFATEHDAVNWIAEHSEALQETPNDEPPKPLIVVEVSTFGCGKTARGDGRWKLNPSKNDSPAGAGGRPGCRITDPIVKPNA